MLENCSKAKSLGQIKRRERERERVGGKERRRMGGKERRRVGVREF